MVSNTENNNEVEKKPTGGLPEGQYRLIGWDIDTTGRRLIDEICQIAAYTPTSKFAQYVMPYADLKPNAQRRHNIRVVTMHRYRMLKDLKTNKFIKTKSEISALTDFLTWLEENKGDSTGIILVFHEVRKMAPAMLLEALRRYNLLDRFTAVVKGFANSFAVAEAKCANSMKSFSLKVLSRVLLDKDENLNAAPNRAELCYLIVNHLGQGERQDLDAEGCGDSVITEKHAAGLVQQFSNAVEVEEKELAELKMLLQRQNTFRPVFKGLMSASTGNRLHASHLRRLLVDNNFDFDQLKAAWDNGGKGSLEELLKIIAATNEKEFAELLEIFDCFFDPEKKPVQPKPAPRIHRNSRSQKENKATAAEEENAAPLADVAKETKEMVAPQVPITEPPVQSV